jgi:hypothetical protein
MAAAAFVARLPEDDAEHDCEDHESQADQEQPKPMAFRWMRHAGVLEVDGHCERLTVWIDLLADETLEGEDQAGEEHDHHDGNVHCPASGVRRPASGVRSGWYLTAQARLLEFIGRSRGDLPTHAAVEHRNRVPQPTRVGQMPNGMSLRLQR